MSIETNTLYYGDCLDWMQRWDDACVDLIYLDPPFNSNANYNILYSADGGGQAQYRAFDDTWTWDDAAVARLAMYESSVARPAHNAIMGLNLMLGHSGMLAYLTYMAERLEQIHRLLKPTGSIYLHCDPTASHGLKLLMDAIFGAANFRNEITWVRSLPHNDAHRFGRSRDTIFWYGRSDKAKFSPQYRPQKESSVKAHYQKGEDGRYYQLVSLVAPGGRGPLYEFKGFERNWRFTPENMAALEAEGRIWHEPGKLPRRIVFLEESRGALIQDHWDDINPMNSMAKERLGYPTQKPLALLERIIQASSNEDDVVLDPFCGCGTAIDAARRLNRQWVGIDISSFAIDLIIERRLQDRTIPTRGIPYDMASASKLAREQPFNFESWAVTRLPGFAPNAKQVADSGVDGRATLATKPDNHDSRLALAQIKGGKFNLGSLRDFIGVTERDKAALGCFVTLYPVMTPATRTAVADFGKISVSGYEYPRMQIWPISNYFEKRLPSLPIMADPYSGKPLLQDRLL